MIFKITPWSSDDEDSTVLDLTIISLYSFLAGDFWVHDSSSAK